MLKLLKREDLRGSIANLGYWSKLIYFKLLIRYCQTEKCH